MSLNLLCSFCLYKKFKEQQMNVNSIYIYILFENSKNNNNDFLKNNNYLLQKGILGIFL